ncbi:MAG: chloride channel protein [Ruminiclostridium sp.]|nr:chloride channel protein [Ruminiclostridium sp.]
MEQRTAKRIAYLIFCALLGAAAALVVWVFLRLMELGIGLLWETVPARLGWSFYPVVMGLLGGLILGLYKGRVGDCPDELETVLKKVKRDKAYPYDNLLPCFLCALLPLVFGASIGPEAGLTGIIVGLCYWVRDHRNAARQQLADLPTLGISAALGVVFGSPLFGLAVPLEEPADGARDTVLPRAAKLVSNVAAVLAAFGVFWGLNQLFGGSMGLPRVDGPDITSAERLWGIPLALLGVAFGYLYLLFERLTHRFFTALQGTFPLVVSTTLGGLILGILGTCLPLTLFSGEEQMAELTETYLNYAPWLLILTGGVKLFLTNVCIQSGWRGGHFFPVIFCGVSIGCGVAMLSGLNEAFCLGVITAGLLGVILRRPLAVTLLLLLCFPVRVIPWLMAAAYIGSLVPRWGQPRAEKPEA